MLVIEKNILMKKKDIFCLHFFYVVIKCLTDAAVTVVLVIDGKQCITDILLPGEIFCQHMELLRIIPYDHDRARNQIVTLLFASVMSDKDICALNVVSKYFSKYDIKISEHGKQVTQILVTGCLQVSTHPLTLANVLFRQQPLFPQQ